MVIGYQNFFRFFMDKVRGKMVSGQRTKLSKTIMVYNPKNRFVSMKALLKCVEH